MTLRARVVTLVLVDAQGAVLGALAPFDAATPAWLDIGAVLAAVQARHGLQLTILRLLEGEGERPRGGAVSYLAQLPDGVSPIGLLPWSGALPDHPLRQPHAQVGGPAADLAWAHAVLQSRGGALAGPPQQMRSWGLSSLWRLPTTEGPLWLKVVPRFFAHEGPLIQALAGEAVPQLVGQRDARMLMREVSGQDQDAAGLPGCLALIGQLVALQSRWLGRTDSLLALGLPDWRAPALTAMLSAHARRSEAMLTADDCELLQGFVQTLPRRWAEVQDCGIPDGLVHGDFHPGNARGDAAAMTLLDWADSGVGHPMLDLPPLLHRLGAADAAIAQSHWTAAWRQHLPLADSQRAATLLAPVACLRLSALSQRFIDLSEPVEHTYHVRGVAAWMRQSLELLRTEDRR